MYPYHEGLNLSSTFYWHWYGLRPYRLTSTTTLTSYSSSSFLTSYSYSFKKVYIRYIEIVTSQVWPYKGLGSILYLPRSSLSDTYLIRSPHPDCLFLKRLTWYQLGSVPLLLHSFKCKDEKS